MALDLLWSDPAPEGMESAIGGKFGPNNARGDNILVSFDEAS